MANGFPLSKNWAPKRILIIILFLKRYALLIKKLTNKYKEKHIILQSTGIIFIKSKETRVITYTPARPADILVGAFNFYNSVMLE